jgi:hypothetical protein
LRGETSGVGLVLQSWRSEWFHGIPSSNVCRPAVGAGIGQHHGRSRGTTREARIEAMIPLSGSSMDAGFDSVWMMDVGTKKLIRIHADDNSVTEIAIRGIVGPFNNAGIALGEGAVWVPDHGRSMIYKIDPKANQVVKEIAADLLGGGILGPRAGDAIAVGEGTVWEITNNNELRRYSAQGGTQEAVIPCHPAVQGSSSPSARSGSRGEETMNFIALIRPPIRLLRQSTSVPIRVPW